MDSDEYQLTIKSANQKVDDYSIRCCPNWNVKRLKQHISETHINNPSIEDQRLIYAGNLLKDHQILKQIFFRDSLCTELTNSSKTDFTIHLVCSQNNKTINHNSSSKTTATNTPAAPSSSNATTAIPTSQQPLQQSGQSSSTAVNNDNPRLSESGNSSNQSSTTTMTHAGIPPITQPYANIAQQSEMIRNLMQSDHMRQQMAHFQQLACMFAAQLAANVNSTNGVPINFPTPLQTINNQTPSLQIQASTPPVVEPPPPPPRPEPEVQGQMIQPIQHDVIDWVYYSIRAAILVAALYIHASMFRILFIVGLLAIAYFFNRRSARRINNHPNNRQEAAARAAPAPARGLAVPMDNELRRRNPQGQLLVEDNRNNNGSETNEGVNRANPEERAPGRLPILKLCYLVLTDFLASLVPE